MMAGSVWGMISIIDSEFMRESPFWAVVVLVFVALLFSFQAKSLFFSHKDEFPLNIEIFEKDYPTLFEFMEP